MADIKTQLPPYCVIKPQKGHDLIYFQVPKHIRPAGWKSSYRLGRTDQDDLKSIIRKGKEFYADLKESRRQADLKIERGPPLGSLAHIIILYKKSEYWLNLKPATQQGYNDFLETIRKWSEFSRHPHIQDYRPHHISKFLENWKAHQRARKYYRAILSILWNVAISEGLTESNIVKEIRLPRTKVKKRKLVVWEESDVEKFLATADVLGLWNVGTAVAIGFETGQRQTDILAFQEPRDFSGGKFVFQTSKTDKPLYIPATAQLKARLAQRPGERAYLTVNDLTQDRWTKNAFQKKFRTVTAACGMEAFTFRQLRNSAAIHSERANYTDAEFETIFGWPKENVRAMMREYYGERDQAVADRAVAKREKYRKKSRSKVGRKG